LRELVPVALRRSSGAFFTGRPLANRAARLLTGLDSNAVIYDPACGAGDLLLAAAHRLALGKTLAETLDVWGNQLQGGDIRESFTRIAKHRLFLLAASQFPEEVHPRGMSHLFPFIRPGNALDERRRPQTATHVLVNPPFTRLEVPGWADWASGETSSAAVFCARMLEWLSNDAQMVAILPDVLRSGTNYRRWRDTVRGLVQGRSVRIARAGRFDAHADVDVFLFSTGSRRGVRTRLLWWRKHDHQAIGDLFDVHVGPVVPHREDASGPLSRYLDVAAATPWRTISASGLERRRTNATQFAPPFVVVRRTSAAADKHRVIATLVRGREKVAVENHLLVVIPKSGRAESSSELFRRLATGSAARWVGDRIRCRHLTVRVLAEAPW
jgi:hypothetical protein